MHFKVYLSDEGFGHIVRQRAIVEVLREKIQPLQLTLQTQAHIEAAGNYIPGANLIKRFNNIQWDKQTNGSPDLAKISQRYENYIDQSTRFIESECADFSYDAILSDFVYEAFPIGRRMGVKTFGVAHFTWDWFFSKLYPPPVHTDVIRHFMSMADQATRLYFPPFTPEEIIHHYKGKAMEVPLILHSKIDHKEVDEEGKFKVLIMDSGAGVLSESIKKALRSVASLNEFLFFVSSKFESDQANVRHIPHDALMVDYVANNRGVIGFIGVSWIGNPEDTAQLSFLKKVKV